MKRRIKIEHFNPAGNYRAKPASIVRLKGQGGRTNGDRVDTSWFEWPRYKHSEKPEAFQDVVERVCPGPYLEIFARRKRLGWHAWGNEVPCDVVMPNAEVSDGGPLTHKQPAAQSRRSLH